MKKKLLLGVTVVLVCAALLLAGSALRSRLGAGYIGSRDVALAQAGETGPAPAYYVAQEPMLGEGYQLANLAWRVSGTASGESYVLVAPAAATLRGSGCCCTYLPIAVRGAR
jgi:hypothetical protein